MSHDLEVLFNPAASGWQQHGETLHRLAARDGAALRELDTESRWIDAVSERAESRRENLRLCVCGGDGTVSRVVESLYRAGLASSVEVAVVPLGTGNDFARSIGVQNETLEQAWRLAFAAESTWVDAIRVNGSPEHERIIVNAATAGFGGIITDQVEDVDKQRWGALAYWVAAFSRLTSLPEYRVTITRDSEQRTIDVFGIAITSGRYVGGGFPVSSEAWINDGLLDVTVVPVMPLGDAFAAGIEFTLGRDSGTNLIETHRVASVHMHSQPPLPYSLDGEGEESVVSQFEVIPNAIRFATAPLAPAVKHHRNLQAPLQTREIK